MQSYEFITVEEVAERLQVSRATIFNWMHMGIFSDGKHYFKRGRVLRFAWGDDLVTTLMGAKQENSENKAVVNSVRFKKTSPLNWDTTEMKNKCAMVKETLEGGKLDNGNGDTTVTLIDHLTFFDNEEKKQGTIIRKNGSKKLYILFYYHNRRVEKSTGLNDTKKNREKVQLWLDRISNKRDAGKLVFAEAFPGASEERESPFRQIGRVELLPAPPRTSSSGHMFRSGSKRCGNITRREPRRTITS